MIKKSIAIKYWFFDLELIKCRIKSVLVWIKIYGFDIKYWSFFGFSKIGSIIGKFIVYDFNI